MSSNFETPNDDFFYDEPSAITFVDAQLEAYEKNKRYGISEEQKRILQKRFELTDSRLGALVYLSEHRAQEFRRNVQCEILSFESNGGNDL